MQRFYMNTHGHIHLTMLVYQNTGCIKRKRNPTFEYKFKRTKT